MTRQGLGRRIWILVGSAVVLLAAASTVSVAAAMGAFRDGSAPAAGRQCTAPALAGSVVDVGLMNMMHGGSGGGMASGSMRLTLSTDHVTAGKVSFRVENLGTVVHELVVLPLPAGQAVGDRVVASSGKVDEAGSVGEASSNCASGPGAGLDAGSIGWVTVQLAPGNYELICNLPGHYGDGMHSELTVS